MNHWTHIRHQARARRGEIEVFARRESGQTILSLVQLLEYAGRITGLVCLPVRSDEPLLYGAQATLDDGYILYNADAEVWLQVFYQAHEFAHHWLHQGVTLCQPEDVDFTASEDRPQFGASRIEAYGPHQRRETEANVFAREFLLPGDLLRGWFVDENLNAARIAERTGINLDFVMHSLAHALLVPDDEQVAAQIVQTSNASTLEQSSSIFTLDASQRAAAESSHTPLLVVAGPGTGKTRALVGRVLHLIETGVSPNSILALTFSNKAAEELRERVQVYAPQAASQIAAETFHSFGLETLRRYWQQANLNANPTILDPVDALFILERHLPELKLDHYQNIYEPATHLASILSAISRAKDELCTPARYIELAQRMLDEAREANDEDALRRAERALEVGRVYEFYQTYLEREQLLDFGDLIARTVRLLYGSPQVCDEVRDKYRHVLVDEYQDTNRACGVLLRLLTNDGAGLWVVGDIRQAIYRWRGANPLQVKHFLRDFPDGKIVPLAVNYRSLPSVVEAVSTFAAKMSVTASSDDEAMYNRDAPRAFANWKPHRQPPSPTSNAASEATLDAPHNATDKLAFAIATDAATEARGIARLIKARHAQGAAFKSNAVICRTHSQLARIARDLEIENVPALYLGDIFERAEVRDLLAFIALACEPSGRTLLRVARFPQYDIPLARVRELFKAAREAGTEFPAALINHNQSDDAPPDSTGEGLTALTSHLARTAHIASAWKLLTHYLFIHSGYLTSLLSDTTIGGANKRLAIYQLLQFVHTQAERAATTTREPDARRALLKYIRRLMLFSEDKSLRQVPAAAANLDAVHLVTVHAAKGLEWDAVYLPNLGKGHFPHRRQADLCPPPAGMIETFSDSADATLAHTEEEECLFFVALSRARDRLHLSRAATYGATNSNPSEFLEHLAAQLSHDADGAATWFDEEESKPATIGKFNASSSTNPAPRFTERALANYRTCPRKYFYENVFYLKGKGGGESAYLKFHNCVYEVLRWLANAHGARGFDDIEHLSLLAETHLANVWRERGATAHIYESLYLEQARLMIERAVRHATNTRGTMLKRDWIITRPHALISVTLDHIELIENGSETTLIIRHTRTGRPPSSKPPDDSLYGLYYTLAAEHFPRARVCIQVIYLSTDETIELDLKPRTVATRTGHYDTAIDSILAGEFPHTPAEHLCSACAHLFTCPKAEE